jgi:large subunit ribosomal protein L30
MTGDLRITLVRSLSGRTEYVRRVVRGLGLTRLHRSVTRKNTPEIRGMVEKAKFLLRVETVGESE